VPAIPVQQPRLDVPVQQGIFERGDHIYLTTPVSVFKPTGEQIEEYAFSGALKSQAPNENIVWLKGQYVEAGRPNANGAMWKAEELSIKSLTPMLMPVTVMHDPRTAVGTIADVKMLTPEKDSVSTARIDTVLALWGHRFPEVVAECEVNAKQGTLMQSMECFSPWYQCSVCERAFHKLPGGAEKVTWCEHLKASNPSAGYVDAMASQSSNASRILGDVCFTGTGLIFGTQGARGAYDEAHLERFQEELAAHHSAVHATSSSTVTPPRSANMGLVQIEQSELDTLRKERDDARTEAATAKQERDARPTTEQLEAAEAAKATAETERDAAKTELTAKNEELAKKELATQRLGSLGDGFTAKLGEVTKTNLDRDAETASDEAWDNRLKELEEAYAVKRDAKKDGSSDDDKDETAGQTLFTGEEVAAAGASLGNGSPSNGAPSRQEQSSVIGSLAGAFGKKS
jgi:hypothetical protein